MGPLRHQKILLGPETLYNGSTINSSDHGFGSYTYPDRKRKREFLDRKTLLMGSYYIRELSRSEDMSLSVTGKNLVETNRGQDQKNVVRKAGQVCTGTGAGLSEHNSMEAEIVPGMILQKNLEQKKGMRSQFPVIRKIQSFTV